MKISSISNPELNHFLKADPTDEPAIEVDLATAFQEILDRANEFLPSAAGAIFMKDSSTELQTTVDMDETISSFRPVEFVVAATFGFNGHPIDGKRLPVTEGIAGEVFLGREAFTCAQPDGPTATEWEEVGAEMEVRSVVAVPLFLRDEVVGVLELVNQKTETAHGNNLALLKILAGTLSATIAYAVEAQRSRETARRDDLTRLYNDRHLHRALAQVIEEALADTWNCGLVFFDLDHFKAINDTHGHLAGSRVLSEMGNLLRQVLPGPAIAARYGGDEFVVILPQTELQESYWVAEAIRKTIEDHFFLAQEDPDDPIAYPALRINTVTASVGLAMLRDDTLDAFESGDLSIAMIKNEFLRRADSRMYQAKESGRNQTVAAPEFSRLQPQSA